MTKPSAVKKKVVAVFVRVPEEAARFLDEYARACGMTRSQVARLAIVQFASRVRVSGVKP
jgi:predicted transcriptional regulator